MFGARMRRGRNPNHASTIYRGRDGYWHGRVTVGVRDDGSPDWRHVMRRSQAAVVKAVRELERQRDRGSVRATGRVGTVGEWLTHWVENIAAPSVRENTLAGHRVAVDTHLIPAVGAHRLDRLEPKHLERLYAKMIRAGSAPGTRIRRTARSGPRWARPNGAAGSPGTSPRSRRPLVGRSLMSSRTPSRRYRRCCGRCRRARWAVALALGLRQGEVLGLRWSDVDLDTGSLWQERRLLPAPRPRASRDRRHEVAAGRRVIGLPAELVTLLEQHRHEQEKEKIIAAQRWRDSGYVFTTERGEPVNPNEHRLPPLEAAARRRRHPGRAAPRRQAHGAILPILGVPERAVMGLMGWSTTAMAARYQHITAVVRGDVAQRVGGLSWGPGSAE